jgi:hypothetical protein
LTLQPPEAIFVHNIGEWGCVFIWLNSEELCGLRSLTLHNTTVHKSDHGTINSFKNMLGWLPTSLSLPTYEQYYWGDPARPTFYLYFLWRTRYLGWKNMEPVTNLFHPKVGGSPSEFI